MKVYVFKTDFQQNKDWNAVSIADGMKNWLFKTDFQQNKFNETGFSQVYEAKNHGWINPDERSEIGKFSMKPDLQEQQWTKKYSCINPNEK